MTLERLGPYRIIRQIGEGGMGAVYEAVADGSEERVAVKVLTPMLARQPGFRARFEIEIATLRKLSHPNIVSILGFGEQGGLLFYSMELVQGATLEDALQRNHQFDWPEVARIGIQVARALKHAHDRGVIHRDIKPANMLLTADGTVKIADFGIARLYGNVGLTLDGGILGTANYMSPEQADGQKVTERSDLYALGCTLYTLLRGRPPFVSTSVTEMLRMQRTAAPPALRGKVRDLPPELELIIHGLLEKDPAKRLPSAGVLAKALQAVQDAVEMRQHPPTPSPPEAEVAAGEAPPFAPPGETSGGGPAGEQEVQNPQQVAVAETIVRSDPTARQDPDATLDHPRPPTGDESERTIATGRGPASGASGAFGPSGGSGPSGPSGGPGGPVLPARSRLRSLVGGAAAAQPESPSASATFITAEEAARREQQAAETEERARPRTLPLGLLLLIGLAVVAMVLAVVLLRPPSADALHQFVTRAADSGSEEELLAAERYIVQFARLYPDDPRLPVLRAIGARVELTKEENRLRTRAKMLARGNTRAAALGRDALSPVERALLEAINHAELQPELGILKLQALLDVFDDAQVAADDQKWLELARRQLQTLRAQVADYAAADLLAVKRRLQRALDLRESEPHRARAIAEGIVELYSQKPWAQDAVAQAQQLLDTLPR